MDALHKIYHNLQDGKSYGKQMNKYKYSFFYNQLCLTESRDEKFIAWTHYGSSANQNTLGDLAWIINTIFDTTPEKFAAEYECR